MENRVQDLLGYNPDGNRFEDIIRDLVILCEKYKKALQEINKEELNSQRPGGGYSKSATISYEALLTTNEKVNTMWKPM